MLLPPPYQRHNCSIIISSSSNRVDGHGNFKAPLIVKNKNHENVFKLNSVKENRLISVSIQSNPINCDRSKVSLHTPAPSAPDAAAIAAAYDHDDIDPVLVQNLPHPLKTKIKNNNNIFVMVFKQSFDPLLPSRPCCCCCCYYSDSGGGGGGGKSIVDCCLLFIYFDLIQLFFSIVCVCDVCVVCCVCVCVFVLFSV